MYVSVSYECLEMVGTMARMDVMLVVGARPQFIKSAPLIREILSRHRQIRLSIVHSGQHYDPEMSDIFFRELRMPEPMVNLQAGSGSHAEQTATIMKRLEGPMIKAKPDVVIVPGDTNTTLAAALTAAKLNIPVAHLEAGLRSGDMTMPEEINRRLTDHCSALLFAPTQTAVCNLKREGLSNASWLTGDTMVDALHIAMPQVRAKERAFLEQFRLRPHQYVLVTLHRPSNVDNHSRFRQILIALDRLSKRLPVIFPVHPRTLKRLDKLGLRKSSTQTGVIITRPQGCIETLGLLHNASSLLTDSGGMQKEAFLLRVPCITLRSNTEWPETLEGGANRLLVNPEMIPSMAMRVASDEKLRDRIGRIANPFGNGHSSAKIAHLLRMTF